MNLQATGTPTAKQLASIGSVFVLPQPTSTPDVPKNFLGHQTQMPPPTPNPLDETPQPTPTPKPKPPRGKPPPKPESLAVQAHAHQVESSGQQSCALLLSARSGFVHPLHSPRPHVWTRWQIQKTPELPFRPGWRSSAGTSKRQGPSWSGYVALPAPMSSSPTSRHPRRRSNCFEPRFASQVSS